MALFKIHNSTVKKLVARDLTQPKPIGHWGNGDYEVKLEKESELEAVFALIKQSYDLNK